MLGESLHQNTQAVLQAWRRLSMQQPVGVSAAVPGPSDDDLIGQLFVLGEAEPNVWTFRSAGERFQALLGREFADQDFLALWSGADRTMVAGLIRAIAERGQPGLIRAMGETLGRGGMETEISLAPLELPGRFPPRRMLGLYQPRGKQNGLSGRPIARHRLLGLMTPDRPLVEPQLRLVASND